jgi:hypothetical protein
MPTYPTCEFCNRNDSPPDKEELLAKWIAREFPKTQWTVTTSPIGRKFKTQKQFGLTTRKFCGRCNNTWMSKLESKVKPILTPMIHGTRTALSPADQLVIAKWATKSAIVYDTHNKDNPEYFFTRDDCKAFFDSGALPFPNTYIYLAHYYDLKHEQVMTKETRRKGSPAETFDAESNLFELETYAMTFAIKHLALQVFTFRGIKEYKFFIPARWLDATIQVWPVKGNISWPPRVAFDKPGFELFADRWRSPNIVL